MLDVLVITNIPTPYNDALFGEVARQGRVRLHVAYCAEREANRSWSLPADKPYSYEVLPGRYFGGSMHVNPAVARLVEQRRPTVALLSGSYSIPTLQMGAAALRARGIPWLYWGEQLRFEPLSPARRVARDALRWVVRRAIGVLAIGRRAITSYVQAGVPSTRVANFHYYPDVDHFQMPAERRLATRQRMRAQFGFDETLPVFVFCGQLIQLKGVDTLLEATATLVRDGHACGVLIAGDGPLRAALEAQAERLAIADAVRFAGFVQPAELPDVFAAADAFVLPSRKDGWGLVVPEAMAAGLPVIASDQVNAAVDLLPGSDAGWVVPANDAGALAARMRSLTDREVARRMGAAARHAVASEAPDAAARRLVDLLGAGTSGEPLCSR